MDLSIFTINSEAATDAENRHHRQTPSVIVSNKGIAAINNILIDRGLWHLTTGFIVGDGTPGFKLKPNRQCWDEIIKPRFPDVEPERVLVIGDTLTDIQFARNIGAKICWAKYGYGEESLAMERPDFTVEKLWDIIDLLSGIEPSPSDAESSTASSTESDGAPPSYRSNSEPPAYDHPDGS